MIIKVSRALPNDQAHYHCLQSSSVYQYISIIIFKVHHVPKHTRASLPMQHWDTISQCQHPKDQEINVQRHRFSHILSIALHPPSSLHPFIYHFAVPSWSLANSSESPLLPALMVTGQQVRVASLAAMPWWWLASRFELRPLLPAHLLLTHVPHLPPGSIYISNL